MPATGKFPHPLKWVTHAGCVYPVVVPGSASLVGCVFSCSVENAKEGDVGGMPPTSAQPISIKELAGLATAAAAEA